MKAEHKIFPLAMLALMAGVACDSEIPAAPEAVPQESVLQNVTLERQVDRFGLPAINTVFIPSGRKDLYNQSAPAGDPAQFQGDVEAFLTAVESLAPGRPFDAATLASVLLPDVQPLLFPGFGPALNGFPSGRQLENDVIDTELFLIFGTNAALNSDHVDQNDVPFLAEFPYLGQPHTP